MKKSTNLYKRLHKYLHMGQSLFLTNSQQSIPFKNVLDGQDILAKNLVHRKKFDVIILLQNLI
jgi:hypothetical protein